MHFAFAQASIEPSRIARSNQPENGMESLITLTYNTDNTQNTLHSTAQCVSVVLIKLDVMIHYN